MRRPCIEPGCNQTGDGARCPAHQLERDQAKNKRRHQNRPTIGAAAKLRNQLRRQGATECNHCGFLHPRRQLEVDHIIPLADGGTDQPQNLQILCIDCHRAKSTTEHKARTAANPEATQLGKPNREWG